MSRKTHNCLVPGCKLHTRDINADGWRWMRHNGEIKVRCPRHCFQAAVDMASATAMRQDSRERLRQARLRGGHRGGGSHRFKEAMRAMEGEVIS